LARGYYAAGRTARPLLFACVSVAVSVLSAAALSAAFNWVPMWRDFLESLLRVSDLPGTTVLMLALGYTLGALAQAALGIRFFARDFSLSLRPLSRLVFESFSSSVIGGAAAYVTLAVLGQYININTTLGVVSEGFIAGLLGLIVTAVLLALLRNRELRETWAALHRRYIAEAPALEATEIS
jgi:peptidoglycan biosynthesis protein MviN/MurJ (putative lipid II flippase)